MGFKISKKVMNMAYGLGAAVVIIGALMKIIHKDLGPLTGSMLLTIGLVTEALIFALSAFDTPEELTMMRERLKAAGMAAPQYNAVTRSGMQNSLTLPAAEVEKRLAKGDPYIVRVKMPRNITARKTTGKVRRRRTGNLRM